MPQTRPDVATELALMNQKLETYISNLDEYIRLNREDRIVIAEKQKEHDKTIHDMALALEGLKNKIDSEVALLKVQLEAKATKEEVQSINNKVNVFNVAQTTLSGILGAFLAFWKIK